MKNSEFIRGKVPVTKEEVRALVLNKLELGLKQSFVDVGAGTGTVGIEAALSYPQLEVTAIECKEEAYNLTRQNMEKFGVKNMKLISGDAPVQLEHKVDAVFLGGTGGRLEEILGWCHKMLTEGGKLVANFIILDTFYEALQLIEEMGFTKIEVSQVSISKLEKLGKGRYFKPENPVFIIEAVK